MKHANMIRVATLGTAAFSTFVIAQPAPTTPAVTLQFTIFVGSEYSNYSTECGSLFAGDLRSDAWSREVSVERGPQFCAADWDNSGGEANSSDFLAYLNDFSNEHPAADLAPPVTGDGIFDSSDFLAFLNLYAQGC